MGIASAGDDVSVDGRAVANYVLDYCERRGRVVTNLSLQKIIYFCHVWCLIQLGRPLVKHAFEAWEFGPVLPYVYRDFKVFGEKAITSRAQSIDWSSGRKTVVSAEIDDETSLLLDKVIDFYSQLRASDLVSMSHVKEGPWDKVWCHKGKANPGMKIDNESIRSFYSDSSIAYSSNYELN